ncbi:MAG TPA: beta-xylosidase, partial [Acidobacteriaceae bacterium]
EWKNTPIIFGESDPEGCAACKGASNGYRNGPLYGVSVAEATMRAYALAQKYGVHLEGAVTWAFEMEDQPPFEGFRELATNGIDKPVLNVFRMMGKLGGEWLQTESAGALSLDDIVQGRAAESADVNAVATVEEGSAGHQLSILLWNYHDDDLPAKAAAIQVNVDGLDATSVTASEYRMDATHSNAYAEWQKMGSPARPTAEQQKQLEAAGALDESVAPHRLAVAGQATHLSLSLPRQGVALVRLTWK